MTNNTSQERSSFALAYAWGQYRVYAFTSRKIKKTIASWRLRVLLLGIAGAVLGLLCQESIRLEFDKTIWSHLPSLLGGLSALAMGLATYFGKELVNPEQERNWIRARSMAESLKSSAYIFLTGAAPYDKEDRADRLLSETEKLLESIKDLPHETISEEEKLKGLPAEMPTAEGYIKKRVDDQINNFYRPRAKDYTKKMENNKNTGLVLGVIAILLGALGSTGWTAGWVAVISTLATSIAAYAYAGRFQYLIISYQATANRLELLKTRWQASGMTDNDVGPRNKLILDCEEAISIENSSWMAELTKESQQMKNDLSKI